MVLKFFLVAWKYLFMVEVSSSIGFVQSTPPSSHVEVAMAIRSDARELMLSMINVKFREWDYLMKIRIPWPRHMLTDADMTDIVDNYDLTEVSR